MLERIKGLNKLLTRLLPLLVLFVFVIPILIYWAYFHLVKPISPYFEGYDPEFPYLMNSLEVFKGHPYAFVDHPGTPVEILGTLFYAIFYPFLKLSPQEFVLYNLQHPGLFLNVAHAFLTLANIACVVFFFVVATPVKRLENALVGSALATMFFAIHTQSFFSTSSWSHNSFAFPFGTPLLLLLYKSLTKEQRPEIPLTTLIVLGAGAGVLAAITIYLAAWLVGILLAILISYRLQQLPWKNAWRAGGIVIAAALISFCLVMLPVLYRAPYFFDFILGLFTQKNPYSGKVPLMGRIALLWQDLPILVISAIIVVASTILALFVLRKRAMEKPGLWGVAVGLTGQIVVLGASVAIKFHTLYVLSVAATLPVLLLALLRIVHEYKPFLGHTVHMLMIPLVALGLGVSLRTQLVEHRDLANEVTRFEELERSVIGRYAHKTNRASDELVILWTYSTYSPCLSLIFGNIYADNALSNEIESICPNSNMYDISSSETNKVTDAVGDNRVYTPRGYTTLGETTWDIFIGCEEILNDAKFRTQDLVIRTPTPPIEASCGHGQAAPLVIAYKK